MSVGNSLLPNTSAFTNTFALFLVICISCLFILIEQGFKIPVLSSLVNPILAEKEKTHQMENIIAWKITSKEYDKFNFQFIDSTSSPVIANNVISRKNRPPTTQQDIDLYMKYINTKEFNKNFELKVSKENRVDLLYVTFGNKLIGNRKLIYTVEGNLNGNAYVFR
jgi:hypothetical protein